MTGWGSTTDRILLLLEQEPMTKAEICRRLDLTHDQVASVLSRLHKRSKRLPKRIYIVEYTRHTRLKRTYLRAVYALGNKPDKESQLLPLTIRERHVRYYQKRVQAVRNNNLFHIRESING